MAFRFLKLGTRLFLIAAPAIAVENHVVYGYLGSFEAQDGYVDVGPFDFSIGPFYDVSQYNAGEYGSNSGPYAGYSSTTLPRLWKKAPYLPSLPPQHLPGQPALPYATSHRFSSNASPPVKPLDSARALVITTNTQGWTGLPNAYEYAIDSFDLKGVNPINTGNQTIKLSFYSCASLSGVGDSGVYQGGLGPGTVGHTTSFFDGLGNLGVEIGYIQPGTAAGFCRLSCR